MNPNPEDQNPAQPNIRDDAVHGVAIFVMRWFIALGVVVLTIIVWMLFSLTRPAKGVEEYASYYPSHGNIVIYPDDAVSNVVVMNNRFHSVTNGDVEFTEAGFVFTNYSRGPFVIMESAWEPDSTSRDRESFISYHDSDGDRWLWSSVYTNNWHWANVVFSSTREPVVTKTNGEWRITFR